MKLPLILNDLLFNRFLLFRNAVPRVGDPLDFSLNYFILSHLVGEFTLELSDPF